MKEVVHIGNYESFSWIFIENAMHGLIAQIMVVMGDAVICA